MAGWKEYRVENICVSAGWLAMSHCLPCVSALAGKTRLLQLAQLTYDLIQSFL